MPVNTITVAAAVTPTVIETWLSHYLNRRPLRQKPTAHISYHEGLELIRRFLHFASFHTVEDLQAFTRQWVPVPTWVDVEEVEISGGQLRRAADYIQKELGPEGIEQVGGKNWWQWRQNDAPLKAEWIEMRKDKEERRKSAAPGGRRIMLYVHGGAYYFGSVDEHRYQMQRHARKLKARVLAPKYRLAPQFPFPCGLQDCLAAYLYLLEQKHDPSCIILAGDSAGGGMVLSMLIILRDQGVPLPAGAILISPWVDLTHSFPSLGGDGKMDYIPAHGFVHKPSLSWPPPNADDLLEFERRRHAQSVGASRPRPTSPTSEDKKERVHGFSISSGAGSNSVSDGSDFFTSADGKYSIGPRSNPVLSVQLNGARVQIKDQIQMYAPNHMLTHPLVSPALHPTLGGLPPLLIQTGGGELLHDEQVYVAHKAAQPFAYLPPESNHQSVQQIEEQAARYRPTNVQLQVWEDLCHVTPTLSFTRPAKHMYRSIAQFGAWALARAQKREIDILDDDEISVVSSTSSSSRDPVEPSTKTRKNFSNPQNNSHEAASCQDAGPGARTDREKDPKVGRAGDPLPPFTHHMIRQRIDRHGNIFALAPPSTLIALNLPRADIGVPKPGPVGKWMAAQKQWNEKFAKRKLKIQKQRLADMERGYEEFTIAEELGGERGKERPPPTALAGRRVRVGGKGRKREKQKEKKSWGLALWSVWGSKHDEATLVREEKADFIAEDAITDTTTDNNNEHGSADADAQVRPSPSRRRASSHRKKSLRTTASPSRSRSRSRRATITDEGQIGDSVDEMSRPAEGTSRQGSSLTKSQVGVVPATPAIALQKSDSSHPISASPPDTLIPATDTLSTRPTRGGIAYPFRLAVEGCERDVNASTVTLMSVGGVNDDEGDYDNAENWAGDRSKLGADADAEQEGERVSEKEGQNLGEKEKEKDWASDEKKVERPHAERFVTADVGGLFVAGEKEKEKEKEREQGDSVDEKTGLETQEAWSREI